ncbi:hypothetical protein J4440_06870 [Candidatus Woesearchaeota archaeon]|nr:hypothetical protein [Candidatus Woesearchaeota archaeon]
MRKLFLIILGSFLIISIISCSLPEYPESIPTISQLLAHPEDYNEKEVNVTGELANPFHLSCVDASENCELKELINKNNAIGLDSACFDANTDYLNGNMYNAIGTLEGTGTTSVTYKIVCSKGLILVE